jgi:hypothetical protein
MPTMTEEMNVAIEELVMNIIDDYYGWTARGKDELSEVNKEMIDRFNKGVRFEVGNKYIKVIQGGSVWGFVVNTDNDKKFRKGDILKAAGWKAPARNKPRGNVIDGGYSIHWTGPHYLV